MKYKILNLMLFASCLCYGQNKLVDLADENDIKTYKYPVAKGDEKEVVKLRIDDLSSGKPLALGAYKNLQILRIQSCDLAVIDINFNEHPLLQSLYISSSGFDTILFSGNNEHFKVISIYDKHFYNYDFLPPLLQLKKVNLGDSLDINMNNLTDNLLKLPNLKEIYIADGNVRKLPSSFASFKQLDWLSFVWQDSGFNYAQMFETIKDIEITNLDLMFSAYKSLPPEIGLLKKVRNLYLRCSQICILPAEIGELTQLESLLCSESQIDSIPNSLVNLKNLKTLELMSWNFKTIPQVLYEMTWLKVLEVGSLEKLPTDAELEPLRKKLKKTKVNKFG